jgi:hypothetical protein
LALPPIPVAPQVLSGDIARAARKWPSDEGKAAARPDTTWSTSINPIMAGTRSECGLVKSRGKIDGLY